MTNRRKGLLNHICTVGDILKCFNSARKNLDTTYSFVIKSKSRNFEDFSLCCLNIRENFKEIS